MPLDMYLQNNNQIYNNPYTPDGYEKARIKKLLFVGIGITLAIVIAILFVYLFRPESQQSKYTKSATAAARKQIPDAKVSDVRVAGGFASATVSNPASEGQASAGNTALFKVNKDGTMVQIADGSSFSPLDLLELGIPLATQSQLTGSSIAHVEQNLANQCGYNDGALGFSGFSGSFNPNGWQIDAATLNVMEQKLSYTISNQNISAKPGKAVICVSTVQKNSNAATNKTTYISTFTLQLKFVTSDGTLTTHTITFDTGSGYNHNYTLDGHTI